MDAHAYRLSRMESLKRSDSAAMRAGKLERSSLTRNLASFTHKLHSLAKRERDLRNKARHHGKRNEIARELEELSSERRYVLFQLERIEGLLALQRAKEG